MRALTTFFSSKEKEELPPASVLKEWEDYSSGVFLPPPGQEASQAKETKRVTTGDIESGFGGIIGAVKSSGGGALKNIGNLTGVSSFKNPVPSVPSRSQFYYFMVLFGVGAFFLFLALTVALPVIAVFPTKFALCFTLGTFLITASFMVLKGWRAQLAHMTSHERLPFTAGFVGSMVMTLYAALVQHSYIGSLIFSGIQVMALLYYLFSYLPGGAAGLNVLTTILSHMFGACFGSVKKSVFK